MAVESNATNIISNNDKMYTPTATTDQFVTYYEEGFAQHFAPMRSGNKVKSYVQSHDYFQDLVTAMHQAKESIYITGWQLNWDAIVGENLRLIDLLLDILVKNPKLHIYILIWNDTAPVNTMANEAIWVLNTLLEKKLSEKKEKRLKVKESKITADDRSLFFSHHQKCVVIDNQKAFIGGIDLAYGRYSKDYNLDGNIDDRKGFNWYNPCIAAMGSHEPIIKIKGKAYDDPKATDNQLIEEAQNKQIAKQMHAIFEQKSWEDGDYIDPNTQPIMPWQDIHLCIEGPAIYDITLNFVLRWNIAYPNFNKINTLPKLADFTEQGACFVQILRSTPFAHRQKEQTAISKLFEHHGVLNELVHGNNPKVNQDDIYRSMLGLINHAQRFIYIENQYFISDFGKSSIADTTPLSEPAKQVGVLGATVTQMLFPDGKATPKNQIVAALAQRVDRHIFMLEKERHKNPFHIYITLPVHSEGLLNAGANMTIIHYTMQTIVFGDDSLLNRIRKSLWVRQQLEARQVPRKEWSKEKKKLYAEIGTKYEHIPLEACEEYVTLLNLRNWAMLGDNCVTEQIYVHSKLMIVDDQYTLVGSANINDRSLSGRRDTEISALVMDGEYHTIKCKERGKAILMRNMAKELRHKLWGKLFGEGLQDAITFPELPSSVKAIRARAKQNTEAYETVFNFIPRNTIIKNKLDNVYDNEAVAIYSSIWPIYNKKNLEDLTLKQIAMPFNAIFWQQPQQYINIESLKQIKGYITLLPLEWTKGENNNIPFHTQITT